MPGRMKWCSEATFAVSVRRGSNRTIRPSRCLRAAAGWEVGTVIREPLDAIGLAPKTVKYDVRSMSGIGSNWWPYIRWATSVRGGLVGTEWR